MEQTLWLITKNSYITDGKSFITLPPGQKINSNFPVSDNKNFQKVLPGNTYWRGMFKYYCWPPCTYWSRPPHF